MLNRLGQLLAKKVKEEDPEIQQVSDEVERLENELGDAGKARELKLRIEVVKSSNFYPSAEMEKVGIVKGYPLYSDKSKSPFTSLSVLIASERSQIRVEVQVIPTPTKPIREVDLPLARQMLEKVDYAGLTKVIQP